METNKNNDGKAEIEKGLVIRQFMDGYFLCTGLPPKGVAREPNEFYIGDTVALYDTWEKADEAKKLIESIYC